MERPFITKYIKPLALPHQLTHLTLTNLRNVGDFYMPAIHAFAGKSLQVLKLKDGVLHVINPDKKRFNPHNNRPLTIYDDMFPPKKPCKMMDWPQLVHVTIPIVSDMWILGISNMPKLERMCLILCHYETKKKQETVVFDLMRRLVASQVPSLRHLYVTTNSADQSYIKLPQFLLDNIDGGRGLESLRLDKHVYNGMSRHIDQPLFTVAPSTSSLTELYITIGGNCDLWFQRNVSKDLFPNVRRLMVDEYCQPTVSLNSIFFWSLPKLELFCCTVPGRMYGIKPIQSSFVAHLLKKFPTLRHVCQRIWNCPTTHATEYADRQLTLLNNPREVFTQWM